MCLKAQEALGRLDAELVSRDRGGIIMTTTHRRRHRLTRIALVTAVAIFSAGGCLSFFVDNQLINAAIVGDLALIEDLLDRGASIEARRVNLDFSPLLR